MSRLRETLLEIQKEKTLRLLLKEKYEQSTMEERKHYLSILGDQIERDVDSLLTEFVQNYRRNEPNTINNKKLRYVYIIANVALTLAGAYAVNEKDWVFVVITGIIMVCNQYLPFIYNNE